jgi:hypothetical protein
VDLRSNGHGHARAPWTAPCARCTGPRWTPPPPFKRRGTRSWPSSRDRTAQDACKRWRRRRRRREAARGESSPALALDSAPGHLSDHGLVQNVVRAHAHVTEGSRGRSCLTGGRHRKGAVRLLRRAHGGAAVRERKGNWAGVNAHSSTVKRASSKTKRIQRRRGLATAAGRAALRRGRGAAPTGFEDVNLQPNELDEPLVNPKRSEGRRRRWSFTDGGACTAAAGTRGGGAWELSSSKRVSVLRVQREAQAIECKLK